MRDLGRLGNEGRPISLKIGTQICYVDSCYMRKFHLQRPFYSRVLDISPSGSRFSVQFWPLFNFPFSNVQLNSDKKKTIFVIPYPLAFLGKILAHGNFSLCCGCYHNLVLFEAYGEQPEMPCFADRIFSMPMFYIVKS